jgi:Zn-dependent protease with chaperone function
MSSAKNRRSESSVEEAGMSIEELCLRALLIGYYPFVALVVVFDAAVLTGFVWLCIRFHIFGRISVILMTVLAVTLVHLLWAMRILFLQLKDKKDEMEIKVPRDMAPRLYKWVESIAAERDLPAPDEIRVAADTVAHIYQRVNGKSVLVFGAIAVRALPQPVLAGVVAHELGHLGAGDTEFGRQARRSHRIMEQLEEAFHIDGDVHARYRYGRISQAEYMTAMAAMLNPAVWAVKLYHLTYFAFHAAHSRKCEYAADGHEVDQSGAEAAARALLMLTVPDNLPWTRLSSLAEVWVQTNQPARKLFEAQVRAAQSIDPNTWQDALRKELRKPTRLFDSHPCLKERLAAMGVSPKKAKQLTPAMEGRPAHELFDGQWPKLETQLADRLLVPFRDYHLAKAEAGEIMRRL